MDAQTEKALARLPELIEFPLGFTEILTLGTKIEPEAKQFVVQTDIAAPTPIIFWFGETGLVCYCQGGATVGMELIEKGFDPKRFFGEDELLLLADDEGMGIVRCPLFPYLDGRNGGFITPPELWVEKFVLIYRELGEKFDGLAAVLIAFNNKIRFGFTALQETHFTYLFNNQCEQLQEEANASAQHRVVEIGPQSPRESGMTDSLLWLVR